MRRAHMVFGVIGGFLVHALAWPSAYGRFATPGVVDLHVDLPYQITAKRRSPADGAGNYVARHLKAAGVVGAVLPLFVPKDVHPTGPRLEDLERVYTDASRALARQRPWLVPREEPACSLLAKGEGVTAFFSFEGVNPFGSRPAAVESWIERDVRLFGLVHAEDSALASSSGYTFRTPQYGLTRRGKQLVRRIAASGGILDVSHASDAAAADMLELANARRSVVVATHSNARKLANHPRNLTDAQIRAVAATGGVVGVAFHAPFLSDTRNARLADVVRHILHIRRIAGIAAVAIGSDFEGGIRPPPELRDVRGFPRLAAALREAGLSQREIEQVFGRNAQRVLCQTAVQR